MSRSRTSSWCVRCSRVRLPDQAGRACVEQVSGQALAEPLAMCERAGGGQAYGVRAVDGDDDSAQVELVIPRLVEAYVGERADRCGATGFQSGEQGSLRGDRGPADRIVEQLAERRDQRLVGGPALDGERALSRGRQHLAGIEQLARLVEPIEPGAPG